MELQVQPVVLTWLRRERAGRCAASCCVSEGRAPVRAVNGAHWRSFKLAVALLNKSEARPKSRSDEQEAERERECSRLALLRSTSYSASSHGYSFARRKGTCSTPCLARFYQPLLALEAVALKEAAPSSLTGSAAHPRERFKRRSRPPHLLRPLLQQNGVAFTVHQPTDEETCSRAASNEVGFDGGRGTGCRSEEITLLH